LRHAPERSPGSYRLSRRLATNPSSFCALTDWTRSATVPGNSGEYRIGSVSFGRISRSRSARRDSRVSPLTYYKAACRFSDWCAGRGLLNLAHVRPPHVAGYIEELSAPKPEGPGLSKPTVKQFDPSHFSRRIAAQRSRFTIFGREKDGLKIVAKRCAERHLVRFDVKKESIPDLKRDLRLAGISEETIFPDLEGLGRELSFFGSRTTASTVKRAKRSRASVPALRSLDQPLNFPAGQVLPVATGIAPPNPFSLPSGPGFRYPEFLVFRPFIILSRIPRAGAPETLGNRAWGVGTIDEMSPFVESTLELAVFPALSVREHNSAKMFVREVFQWKLILLDCTA
jgi:hypothetical protein